jgi:hypothetical protein
VTRKAVHDLTHSSSASGFIRFGVARINASTTSEPAAGNREEFTEKPHAPEWQ